MRYSITVDLRDPSDPDEIARLVAEALRLALSRSDEVEVRRLDVTPPVGTGRLRPTHAPPVQ